MARDLSAAARVGGCQVWVAMDLDGNGIRSAELARASGWVVLKAAHNFQRNGPRPVRSRKGWWMPSLGRDGPRREWHLKRHWGGDGSLVGKILPGFAQL